MIRCLIFRQSISTNAAKLYLESYPERRQPSSRLFRGLKSNLIQYGAFVKPKKEPREIDPDKENIFLGCVQEEPTSVREIERNTGIPKSSAQVILRKHRYHPYKFHICQGLQPGDTETRLKYCRWLQNMSRNTRNFTGKILYGQMKLASQITDFLIDTIVIIGLQKIRTN